MIGPYRVVEESDSSVTYQYNPLYSWALVGILAIFFIGIFIDSMAIQLLSSVLVVLYFTAKIFLGREINKVIRKSLKLGSVELSGRKYSFARPIRIRVPKNV